MGDQIDYYFKLVSPYEWEMTLDMTTAHKPMKWVFEKTVNKVSVKTDQGSMVDEIKEFRAEPRTHNLIKTAVAKQLRSYFAKLRRGPGINVTSINVQDAFFKKRDHDSWEVTVHLKGLYVRDKK